MKYCPRCEGNGAIKRVEIHSIGYSGYMCDECYCMWESEADLGNISLSFFEKFAEDNNLACDFSVFDVMEDA